MGCLTRSHGPVRWSLVSSAEAATSETGIPAAKPKRVKRVKRDEFNAEWDWMRAIAVESLALWALRDDNLSEQQTTRYILRCGSALRGSMGNTDRTGLDRSARERSPFRN